MWKQKLINLENMKECDVFESFDLLVRNTCVAMIPE